MATRWRRAHRRSADFQSAVSPSCTRQNVGTGKRARVVPSLADYKSAIEQIGNLRYDIKACVHRAHSKSHDAIESLASRRREIGQFRLVAGDGYGAADVLPIGIAQGVFELHLVGLAGPGWPGQRWSVTCGGWNDGRIQKRQSEYIAAMIEILSDQI